MKKFFAVFLTIAMLLTTIVVLAENGPQADQMPGEPQQTQTQTAPQQGANGNNDRGNDSAERQAPPEKPSDDMGSENDNRQAPADGQVAPQKPDAAPEKPTGEKPADAPAEPEDLTGGKPADMPERPTDGQNAQTPQGQAPMNGQNAQAPQGQAPMNDQNAQAPQGQAPMNGQNGQAPQGQPPMNGQNGQAAQGQAPMNGQNGQAAQGQAPMNGQGPQMIDSDAMVTKGIISQETLGKIKAYMDEHKPEGEMPQAPVDGQAPMDGQQPPELPNGEAPADGQQPPELPNGEAPADGQQPPEMPTDGQAPADGQQSSLLDELLNAGVITQEEYDAISAEISTGDQQSGMPGMPADGMMPGDGQQSGMPCMPGDGMMPADGQQNGMPGMPGDGMMPGGMGGEASIDYTAAATLTESSDGQTYASSADGENAVLVSGSEVTLANTTVTKTGSSNEGNADFNGTNAAVLAANGASLTIDGTTVTTDGAHANGVFSTGSGTTVNVSNTTITTTGNGSGGIMTTGGATMNATNLTVSTSGNSSAAIRSDRGGGTVTVSEGTYDTTGVGSPAIYSTADITVSNATLSATNSEAVVIEGGNSVTLNDVNITGSNATLNGQSTQKTNVLIYQSMSGDASDGSSTFSMTGGAMTALTGSMFHVTNVTTTITLEDVDFTYASDSAVFLDASADSWGSSGRNGGNVTLNLVNQDITGAITSDSVSSVAVNLDSDSTWTLTGDSYVTSFTGDLSNVNTNGYTLYVNGVAVA